MIQNLNSFFDIIYRCAILPFFIQHKDKLEKLNDDISEMAKVSQIFPKLKPISSRLTLK